MASNREVIDLTHGVEEGMIKFDANWHPEVEVEKLGTISTVGRESRAIQVGTHTGTHVDAPLHFVEGGGTVDDIPLDVLVGDVKLVDMTNLGEGSAVTAEVLADVELNERVVFHFDWARHFGNAERFYHGYPHFTVEAADALIAAGVRLVGYDTPSPDDSRGPIDGSKEDSPIHKQFLGSGVVLVEYLANLDAVPDPVGWTLCAMPLKILGADGAPARVCLLR